MRGAKNFNLIRRFKTRICQFLVMPLLRKTVRKKLNPLAPTNPLADKIGIMRHGVRQLINAKEGSLENAKRKTDAYVKMRMEKNASYVPSTQSWIYLKDPVYSALVDHIKVLTTAIEENYFDSVRKHDNPKRTIPLARYELSNVDSFREVDGIRKAKLAMKAIESRKMTKEEYENWVKKLNVQTKDF